MNKLKALALLEIKENIRVARMAADAAHLKEDVIEYINHLDFPDKYPKPDGMDLNRVANRFIKLLEHCESVEIELSRTEKWMDALLEAAKQQEGIK